MFAVSLIVVRIVDFGASSDPVSERCALGMEPSGHLHVRAQA